MLKFFDTWMFRGRLAVLGCAFALVTQGAQATPMFNLDYASETQLPSAQGLTYTPLSPAQSESSAFSVSGGALHLDTITAPGDLMAYYQLTNGFDHTVDNTLSMKVKVTQMSSYFGLMVGVNDPTYQLYLNITTSGWVVSGTSSSGTFTDPTAFHTFRLDTFAATHGFSLSIDGTPVASGLLTPGYAGETLVIFGDGSPTGGDLKADFQFIRFNAEPAIVPEPSALMLSGIGVASLLVLRSIRNKRDGRAV